MGRMKKVLKISLWTVVGLVAGGLIFLRMKNWDIAPPDVSDFWVERVELSEKENAFVIFKQAYAASSLEEEKDAELLKENFQEIHDEKAVEDLLERNQEMMRLLTVGNQMVGCQFPAINSFKDLIPEATCFLQTAKFLHLKVKFELAQGEDDQATETLLTLLKFGDRIIEAPESLIQYLVGVAMFAHAYEAGEEIIKNPDCSTETLSKIQQVVSETGDFTPGLIRAIKMEFKVVSYQLQDFSKMSLQEISQLDGSSAPPFLGKVSVPDYLYQPNRTREIFATEYRKLIHRVSQPYLEKNGMSAEWGYDLNTMRRHFGNNAIGLLFVNIMLPAMDRVVVTKSKSECRRVVLQLQVGLRQFQLDKGSFPQTIEELVPGYLPGIPTDPFDGQPLRYDPERKIIYSVGENGTDEGGSEVLLKGWDKDPISKKRWNAEDVVYAIE
jgi:hypothetical protein